MYKVLVVLALCATCALGQTATMVPKQLTVQMGDVAEFGQVGITTALAGPMVNVTGAPYSAQCTTERVQVLADGNRIIQTTSGSVARDGQGRVRREESLSGLKTSDGEAPQIVMIDDPVAQVHWTLNAQKKTAMKMSVSNIKFGPFGAAAGSGLSSTKSFFFTSDGGAVASAAVSPGVVLKNGAPLNDVNVTKTDLGTQTVEGLPAQGTRITKTIPAGQIGNEQSIVITTETWYSPDLKVLVMSKSSDPRMGDTTYTLTNIQRSEPAASLFQVPDDYTVKDGPSPAIQVQKNQ